LTCSRTGPRNGFGQAGSSAPQPAFTITNAGLANSATAGWKSNAIDNSSNLYLDALVHCDFAAVNTAPANSKAIFLYAYALDRHCEEVDLHIDW
jgi:hypothetical protein